MLIGVAKLKYEVIEGSTWYLIVFSIVSYVLAIDFNSYDRNWCILNMYITKIWATLSQKYENLDIPPLIGSVNFMPHVGYKSVADNLYREVDKFLGKMISLIYFTFSQ